MASEVFITCDSCDVEVSALVGATMTAYEHLLCACDTCHVFMSREYKLIFPFTKSPKFRCGSCRRPLRVVCPFDDRDAGPLGECPVCGGHLRGSTLGEYD